MAFHKENRQKTYKLFFYVVSVLPVQGQQLDHFNTLVRELKIPSKDRLVFVENLPSKYTEQDIRTFFNGKKILVYIFFF